MGFYPDVSPGDAFQPSSKQENDIRHILNSLGGASSIPFHALPTNQIRVPIYNKGPETIDEGAFVTFEIRGTRVYGCFPVAKYKSVPTAIKQIGANAGIGISTKKLGTNDVGEAIVYGVIDILLDIDTPDIAGIDPKFCTIVGENFVPSLSGYPIIRLTGNKNATIIFGTLIPQDTNAYLCHFRNSEYSQITTLLGEIKETNVQPVFAMCYNYPPVPTNTPFYVFQQDIPTATTLEIE